MRSAMIMAAGLGTRLGEITASKPKILVDIGGITLFEWILGKLSFHGFDNIVVNVHHHADMVESAGRLLAAEKGLNISFSDERSCLLDTGGGLFRARDFFDNKPFLLYNGDIVTDLDLNRLYQLNIESGAIATLALKHRQGKRFFLIDNDGMLRGWLNRETGEKIVAGDSQGVFDEIAFSAISVVNPEIFAYMFEGVYSMRRVFLEAASENIVNSLIHDKDEWVDIGSPEQLDRCRKLMHDSGDPARFF